MSTSFHDRKRRENYVLQKSQGSVEKQMPPGTPWNPLERCIIHHSLDILFCQMTPFIKVRVAFVFELQNLYSIDFT